MAERAKSRRREQSYRFVSGEHVWVPATYFDDPKHKIEERYSSMVGGDGRVFGIVKRQIGDSYTIDFEDGTTYTVGHKNVNLTEKDGKGVKEVTTEEKDVDVDESCNPTEYDDPDWEITEDEEEEESSSDVDKNEVVDDNLSEKSETIYDLKDSEEVYLLYKTKDIMKAKYSKTNDLMVHGKSLDEHHGRFFIVKLLKDVSKWKDFDADIHCVGAPVMWSLSNVRRLMRKPFSELGTEAVFPKPLEGRKRKRNEESWQRNKNKKSVNSGKVITWKNRKGIEQRCGKMKKVKERCPENCKKSNRMVIIALHEMFLRLKLDKLSMNFMVTGHSENENDCAHSTIESKTRSRTLFTPQSWKTAIQVAFKQGTANVNSLKTDDVMNFKTVVSYPEYAAMLNDTTTENDDKVSKKEGKVYWSKIMQYYFVKSDPNKMFYKMFYSAPEFKYTTIYKRIQTRSTQVKRLKLYANPPGITKSKKDALLKLCKEVLIDEEYWPFFENLKLNEVEDSDAETAETED